MAGNRNVVFKSLINYFPSTHQSSISVDNQLIASDKPLNFNEHRVNNCVKQVSISV